MGTPPPIQLASLGMADTLILMVLALVVFGPRRLPQIGRQIGKLMYEFRKASNDFKFQMEEELRLSEDADRRKKEEAARLQTMAATPVAQSVEAQAGIGASEATTTPTEAPAAMETVVILPRIQPPATGEQVSAARPNAPVNPTPEPSASQDSAAENSTDTDPPRTEHASQHG